MNKKTLRSLSWGKNGNERKRKDDIINTFKDYDEKDLFCPECYNPLEETDEEVIIEGKVYKAGTVLNCSSSLCEGDTVLYHKKGERIYGN